MVRARSLLLVLGVVLGACDDTSSPAPPTTPQLFVLAEIDPDFTDRTAPIPGRVVWLSTRAGTARFLLGDRELTLDRVPVSAGELASTDIDPVGLEPGYNAIEIYFVLDQHGGTPITADAQLSVSARCTRHEHCTGSCIDFECVP